MNEALALLVLLWAVLVLPAAIRSSRNASPHVTVGGFERTMEVLSTRRQVPGREVFVPAHPDRIVGREVQHMDETQPIGAPRREDPRIARRRAWFLRLLVVNVIAVAAAVAIGGWMWVLALVATGTTVATVVVLRALKLQRDQAREVVREIDLRDDADRLASDLDVPVAVGHDDWGGSGAIRLRRWDD